MSAGKVWSVYLVRAENGALYCGISDDPARRFEVHRSGRGARFFHSSPARALVYVEACASKGDALRREIVIKGMGKPGKERLVAGFAGFAGFASADGEGGDSGSASVS